MANPFEAIWNTLKLSLDNIDEEKHPLHTGEVTNCWVYYTAMKEFIRFEEAGLNTTNDDEVKEMLKDVMKVCESQTKELEDFMLKEGIPLPELPSKKPQSENNAIPLGVKLTDDEITNGISIKIATAVIECATGQAQSIRMDIGQMWVKFQFELLAVGNTLKALMRKRGWIRIPPYYYPPGRPENNQN